ncbi:MAG: DNA mismatch repair protein MutS [Crocinitomicaceae bacterium]|nr:DNA mismatch repair protein MutS [Crocinitomicaceae bacterium]
MNQSCRFPFRSGSFVLFSAFNPPYFVSSFTASHVAVDDTGQPVETPLMKQYNAIKAKYPDALLLFRVGDFYETFGEDAVRASKVLGIVLTRRKNGSAAYIELAGFPHHSLDTYLPKLVKAGNRVAICDQLEDPKLTKKIVRRGVTELVTPGVSYNEKTIESRANNFLAAVVLKGKTAGVAFLDISTGEFLTSQGTFEYVDKLLQGFRPSEVLYQKHHDEVFRESFGQQYYTFRLDDWVFTSEFGREILTRHFGTKNLKGFGIEEMELGIIASGAALHYLAETQHDKVTHISTIGRIEEEQFVWLDKFTVRNLELVSSSNENATTLLRVIDQTVSPMGSRMMRRWVLLPLKEQAVIEKRLSVVDFFTHHTDHLEKTYSELKQVGDLERLISKVSTGRINPRELMHIRKAMDAIEPIKFFCEKSDNPELQYIGNQLNVCQPVRERIAKELYHEPPIALNKGQVIASGISAELDELRSLSTSGKDYLQQLQERESELTGIPSLKVSYNNVFGYYLEVRNTHKDKVPEGWIRKQTLTQAERYITEELKEYETKILGAEEKIASLEFRIFNELVAAVMDYTAAIQLNAQLLARLDCLMSFAKTALRNHYVRPSINESKVLQILEGRHPVIEQNLPAGEEYISNDIYLDPDTQQIVMITGPNMSGKSAVLRQTALIVLLAQIGSFVPAKAADIGLVDKIFTRVGASDNISSGESTFMVEMNETASILNNISDRSLVLLDEIGRGTSTYDGISIAWAIAEFLHEFPKAKAKTLFATHYHELNEMAGSFKRISNFNVSVKEVGNKVIFLRKLAQGGSNHSFGIHVARMAGMPSRVVQRANEMLTQLEKSHSRENLTGRVKEIQQTQGMQLSFFQLDDPTLSNVRDELLHIDINTLTPVEALMKLMEIKKMVGG